MAYSSLFFAITTCAILCQIYGTGTQIDIDDYEEEFETCPLANIIEQENLRTVGLPISSINGKWVSQTCETRTESNYPYLLRSYTFHSNHTFNLLQIIYADEFCSSAMYAISALGYTNSNHNSNRKLNYELTRVTIVVHDITVARDLSHQVNDVCPNVTEHFWKPYTEYEIFKLNRMPNRNSRFKNGGVAVLGDRSDENYKKNNSKPQSGPNCLLFALNVSFDELYDAKIYRRPFKDGFKEELFLAKHHSKHESKKMMSNSFQLPLVLYNKSQICPICTELASSSQMFPVLLHQNLRMPLSVSLQGEWISERCEPVPQVRFDREDSLFELFMMKNFRIDSESRQWELHTRFYSDASCARLLADQHSYGVHYRGIDSTITPGATDIDFVTEKSFFLVWDSSLLGRIQNDPSCGYFHYWEVGVKVKLLSSCSKIRFNFLNRRNIIKIDYDEQGSEIMYLGNDEDESERPKTFGYPLVRCNSRAVWKFLSEGSSALAMANLFLILVGVIINLAYIPFR